MSHYLGYNAINDYFPRMKLQPNPQCDDRNCIRRQNEYKEKIITKTTSEVNVPMETKNVVHDDNIYGQYFIFNVHITLKSLLFIFK